MTLQDDDPDRLVTVCDKCLMASCWRGVLMCDRAVNAGVVQKTVRELLALGLEHPDRFAADPVNYPEPARISRTKKAT